MRVLFVLPRMVSGGVERVTLNLIESLKTDGIECRLALRRCHGELIEEAEALVEVDELAGESILHFVPRLTRLINEWHPTHIVTAFSDIGLMTLLASRLAGKKIKLIHGIHNTHSFVSRRRGLIGLIRYGIDYVMARALYRRASAIVCVSHGVEEEVKAMCPSAAARTTTIYNPVLRADQINTSKARKRFPRKGIQRIIALGRLTPQKGFDILIQAAAQLPAEPTWRIDIYGDGPMRTLLQTLIDRFNLNARVRLCGHIKNPLDVLANADVFVLSSRYEGFGLVLIEAMSQGLQIIASDCRHGPREILEDGRLGLLVPPNNVAALTTAIVQAFSGEFEVSAAELQARAEQFTTEKAYQHWNALLNSV